MEKSVLEIISERHKEWVYLVECFGCNKDTAEDIVQDMYLKMHKIINKGQNLMYSKTEINSYYVLRTLKSIFIDHTRKHNVHTLDVDECTNIIKDFESVDFSSKYDTILKELKKLYWFDRKVFEIVNSGERISDLSRKTTIPYYTLYNTYKKVYEHLKNLI